MARMRWNKDGPSSTTYRAGAGVVHSSGLEVSRLPFTDDSPVRLTPLRKDGRPGTCWVEVPLDQVRNLIRELERHDRRLTDDVVREM